MRESWETTREKDNARSVACAVLMAATIAFWALVAVVVYIIW